MATKETMPGLEVEEVEVLDSEAEATAVLEELTGGHDVRAEPLWRIRLRLFRRSFAKNWGLFKESKMGLIGLAIIILFGLMAVAHPILMSTVWDPAIYDPVSGYDAVFNEYTIVEDGAVTDPTAEISLKADVTLGKMPTTRVRRRICRFRFSIPLMVLMRRD